MGAVFRISLFHKFPEQVSDPLLMMSGDQGRVELRAKCSETNFKRLVVDGPFDRLDLIISRSPRIDLLSRKQVIEPVLYLPDDSAIANRLQASFKGRASILSVTK